MVRKCGKKMEQKGHHGVYCPYCGGRLVLKYQATYEYWYVLDQDAPGLKNREGFLPYLYDHREQKTSNQFIECPRCHIRQPFVFSLTNKQIDAHQLQQALHAFGQVEQREV